MSVHHLHCVLRPNSDGVWSYQIDSSHNQYGMDLITGVVQTHDSLIIYFSPVFDKAGMIQISTDDGFAGSLTANASLGTQNARIELRAKPVDAACYPPMNPKDVWRWLNCIGPHSKDNGNLWVHIIMMNNA